MNFEEIENVIESAVLELKQSQEVVKVVENYFLRKLLANTRVSGKSYTQNAKNSYFYYFKHRKGSGR